MKKVTVELSKGGSLEIEFTPAFEAQVRNRYRLSIDDEIDSSMLKHFIETEMMSKKLNYLPENLAKELDKFKWLYEEKVTADGIRQIRLNHNLCSECGGAFKCHRPKCPKDDIR